MINYKPLMYGLAIALVSCRTYEPNKVQDAPALNSCLEKMCNSEIAMTTIKKFDDNCKRGIELLCSGKITLQYNNGDTASLCEN